MFDDLGIPYGMTSHHNEDGVNWKDVQRTQGAKKFKKKKTKLKMAKKSRKLHRL